MKTSSIFVVGLAVFLLFSLPAQAETGSTPGFDPLPYAGTRWYGVYLMGEKIGFGSWSLTATDWNGQTAWKSSLDLSYHLSLGGQSQKMTQKEVRIYLPPEGLVRFSFENKSILGTTSASGRKEGNLFAVTTPASPKTMPYE